MKTPTRVAFAVGAALLISSCASTQPRPVAAAPGNELPPGAGRAILQTSCTVCHDLGEVTKFRGYYNRPQWQDIVATMTGYGANVRNEDVDVLVDYLTQSIGRR